MFSNEFMYNRCEKENINWTMKWTMGSVKSLWNVTSLILSLRSLDQESYPNIKRIRYNKAAK